MFDLDPTHGSQAALPPSHPTMLKGFYKHLAKTAGEELFLLFSHEFVQRCDLCHWTEQMEEKHLHLHVVMV